MKLRGFADEITRRGIVGWAVDEEDPEKTIEVIVKVNNEAFASCKADTLRQDLTKVLGMSTSGNHAFRMSFNPPLSSYGEFDVEVIEASTGRRLNNGLRRLTAPRRNPASLRPIMVTSTGRAGTTLLMSEFVRHPRIVVANRYAYEIKLLSYYSAAFKVLTSTLDRTNSTNPDTMFDRMGQFKIGHNPFNGPAFFSIVNDRDRMQEYFEQRVPVGYAELFRDFIRDYYEIVRQEEGKPGALHFAEKVDLDEAARSGARVFFGEVREIVLVRDPRDLLCSAKSFWKLESNVALRMIKTTVPRLFEAARSGQTDVTALKYEDLVAKPEQTRAELYRFLGIRDDDADGTIGDKSLFAGHGTSATAAASIGRWRRDLTTEEVDAVNKAFPDYIEAFGYGS